MWGMWSVLIKALCIWSLPDFCQPALAIWAKLGPGELQSLQLRKWRQMRRPQRTKQNLLVVCKSQEHVQCLRQGGRDRCCKAQLWNWILGGDFPGSSIFRAGPHSDCCHTFLSLSIFLHSVVLPLPFRISGPHCRHAFSQLETHSGSYTLSHLSQQKIHTLCGIGTYLQSGSICFCLMFCRLPLSKGSLWRHSSFIWIPFSFLGISYSFSKEWMALTAFSLLRFAAQYLKPRV